ncbi:MAG: hypothetical protein ACRD3D_06000, partial [Terriglobia bacterium]
LFLSYEGVGNCDLYVHSFSDAEKSFQIALQYAQVWPGINDSEYPIVYESIGLSRIGEQRWARAEEALKTALAIFDRQIERALRSNSAFMRNDEVWHLRRSRANALSLLGVVYDREERNAQALTTLEQAYEQDAQFHASEDTLDSIAKIGLALSLASGDIKASARWTRRMVLSK